MCREIGIALTVVLTAIEAFAAEPPTFAALAKTYEQQARPLLNRFCLECHLTDDEESELDLEQFSTLERVRKHLRVWQKVARLLDTKEMPPEDAEQPSKEERVRLRAWVQGYLDAEAKSRAGDPGRVVLRRLNNVEYTNTVRALTGVALEPAKEFPTDGAAGEGFANTGLSLVMSPALVDKYLSAAKGVAAHAVLMPDGVRFSPRATRRDWTNEAVARIRAFHSRFTDAEGSVPLERYLAATLRVRKQQTSSGAAVAQVARQAGLNEKYLSTLWEALNSKSPSLLLDPIRTRWRASSEADAAAIAAVIKPWQKTLWKFNNVGHFKPWQEANTPLPASQAFRKKLEVPEGKDAIVLHLTASDVGDGNEHDVVTWSRPRLEAGGRAPVLLRDVRRLEQLLSAQAKASLARTEQYLAAVAEIARASDSEQITAAKVASRDGLDADVLVQWLNYVGVAAGRPAAIKNYFTGKLTKLSGYEFVNGWGLGQTPSLISNASNEAVNVPGTIPPHSVVVHPSPELFAAVGWRCPIEGEISVAALVGDAHATCGNGVGWSLELRRGTFRRALASGTIDNGVAAKVVAEQSLVMQRGDLISVIVTARDRNHGCDLTDVDLTITEKAEGGRTWQLSKDVADTILAGNPHDDRLGNKAVWHFYKGAGGAAKESSVPSGSLLARWIEALRDESPKENLARLASAIQTLVTSAAPEDAKQPDAVLRRELTALDGPLFGRLDFDRLLASNPTGEDARTPGGQSYGLDRSLFGRRPDGSDADDADLIVQAPSSLAIRLPAALVRGREFVVDGRLDEKLGGEGSVQLQLLAERPPEELPSHVAGTPIVTRPEGASREKLVNAYEEFRSLFPAAMCYGRIVPVDEVITIVLFHREDKHFKRLMLDEAQVEQLDTLWDELRYVSLDAFRIHDSFDLFLGFASQEGSADRFEPLRKPITLRAEQLRERLEQTQPRHVDAIVEFAARAYRRPLEADEGQSLTTLYQTLRVQDLPHDQAVRLLLARVLVSPSFLYRMERPGPGRDAHPVSDWEIASRLSYFLYSSMPDEALQREAAAGKLTDPAALVRQAKRMLQDDRARALATEFGCQWLGIRNFDAHDEKNEQLYPTFGELRADMYEESVRFLNHLFAENGSVLDLLDADFVFLNERLAKHYGIAGVAGPQWRRVEGVRQHARGGILGMASILSKQSGASRTSPILRGNWVVETLLDEKLPTPPPGVPVLPDTESATGGLTIRQLIQKHSSVKTCAVCHDKIDAYGFALESFDAVGRVRSKDVAGRPIDTKVTLPDGAALTGIDGLRNYLMTKRKEQFLRTFCRKLLGFALARGVQLSDEPLIDEMMKQLRENDYRFFAAVETIVRSKPFRYQRGLEATREDAP